MTLHPLSHTDHVPPIVLGYVLGRFADLGSPLKVQVELPDFLPAVLCNLVGPAMGDPPVRDESAYLTRRGGRQYPSRMTSGYARKVRSVTVIAGPYNGKPCILYTVYGGATAPRELEDPYWQSPAATPAERAEAEAFWRDHALVP